MRGLGVCGCCLGVVAENFEGFVSMPVHIELGMNGAEEPTIRADHEGGTLARQRSETLHAKQLGDLSVRVGEQGEAEVVLLVERFLPIHRIGADPYALGREFRELRFQVAEVAAFNRSARGHRFGVEEQDHRPVRQQFAQANGVPVLVGRNEVINEIVRFHAGDFLSARACHILCASEPRGGAPLGV